MNLKFKSSEPDLKFNIQSQLILMNKNILYLTRQIDLCVKWLKTLQVDVNLQKQVDDYMTSPQTDRVAPPDPADL